MRDTSKGHEGVSNIKRKFFQARLCSVCMLPMMSLDCVMRMKYDGTLHFTQCLKYYIMNYTLIIKKYFFLRH